MQTLGKVLIIVLIALSMTNHNNDCLTYCTHYSYSNIILSHNNPCFQCNIAIMNFLVSHMCEARFNVVTGQSTVPMYSYAKIHKHG